jgi:hypothetical protein
MIFRHFRRYRVPPMAGKALRDPPLNAQTICHGQVPPVHRLSAHKLDQDSFIIHPNASFVPGNAKMRLFSFFLVIFIQFVKLK